MKAIDVLYFDGCPNVDVAMEHARSAVAAVTNGAAVRLVRVDGDEAAVRLRFLGSPTVRVDGLDVDAAARSRTDFGMQCRVYWADGKVVGAPPIAWIEGALRGESNAASPPPGREKRYANSN
jgi:hypothetical protein